LAVLLVFRLAFEFEFVLRGAPACKLVLAVFIVIKKYAGPAIAANKTIATPARMGIINFRFGRATATGAAGARSCFVGVYSKVGVTI
jgi:hypothetical protein